jgi:hypothetical protein
LSEAAAKPPEMVTVNIPKNVAEFLAGLGVIDVKIDEEKKTIRINFHNGTDIMATEEDRMLLDAAKLLGYKKQDVQVVGTRFALQVLVMIKPEIKDLK